MNKKLVILLFIMVVFIISLVYGENVVVRPLDKSNQEGAGVEVKPFQEKPLEKSFEVVLQDKDGREIGRLNIPKQVLDEFNSEEFYHTKVDMSRGYYEFVSSDGKTTLSYDRSKREWVENIRGKETITYRHDTNYNLVEKRYVKKRVFKRDGKLQQEIVKDVTIEYDENGNEKSKKDTSYKYKNGKLENIEIKQNGDVIKSTSFVYGKDDKLLYQYDIEYKIRKGKLPVEVRTKRYANKLGKIDKDSDFEQIVVQKKTFGGDEPLSSKLMIDGKLYEIDFVTDEEKSVDSDAEITIKLPDGTVKSVNEFKNSQNYQQLSDEAKKKIDRSLAEHSNYESRRFWQGFEFVLTEFRGLSGITNLFFEDEDLEEWRENIDKFFATFFLGTDYWTSKICSVYTDKIETGTIMIETSSGMLKPVAHIEAERSQPVIYENKTGKTTEYFYKITYVVDNPDKSGQDMSFNVKLKGERTIMLYRSSQKVEEGSRVSRTGSSMIVRYSPYLYTEICIVFDNTIYLGDGNSVNELCNAVVEVNKPVSAYKRKFKKQSVTNEQEQSEEVDF